MVLGERLRSCKSSINRCRKGVMSLPLKKEEKRRRVETSCGKYGLRKDRAQVVITVTTGTAEMSREDDRATDDDAGRGNRCYG